MASFSGTQQLEEELGEAPTAMFSHMRNFSPALQLRDLQGMFLQQCMAQIERPSSDAESDFDLSPPKSPSQLRCPERERETDQINTLLADLTSKINSLCNRYNEDYSKAKAMENRFKSSKQDYKKFLKALLKRLASIVEKEKATRKECEKLKKKEAIYKAREKVFMEKIRILEEENKQAPNKFEEILNEKCLPDSVSSEIGSYTADDDLSSTSGCKDSKKFEEILNEKYFPDSASAELGSDTDDEDIFSMPSCKDRSQLVNEKLFKYSAPRPTDCVDKELTYRNLRKTRISMTYTDSESCTDEKRLKTM